ncbi:MAG: RICIN domain-containing protein [Bacteroidales bacterium]|nr:RICIN domain-containing protein [Bacteroidales bacterium]
MKALITISVLIIIFLCGCNNLEDKTIWDFSNSFTIKSSTSGYYLSNSFDTITNSVNVTQVANKDLSNGVWLFEQVDKNMFFIINKENNLFLDIDDISKGHWFLVLREKNYKDSQKWFVHKYANGTYKIINRETRLVLDTKVHDPRKKPGIRVWKHSNHPNQYWLFEEIN